MKHHTRISWLLIVFILFSLAACGGGASSSPTSDPNLVYTQIWQTVVAGQTKTASVVPATLAVTSTPEFTLTERPTNTPLISQTPLPGASSVTPSVGNIPQSTSQQACDNFSFQGDVTYVDGSEVPAGQSFDKTWRIKNLGPCSWNQDYLLIFGWGGDGTNWNTAQPVHFPIVVAPGESMDITITLKAPPTAGSYTASFRTQNDNGFNFGTTLTVLIKVK